MPATPLPDLSPALTARGISLRYRDEQDASFIRDVYVAARWEETAVTGWPDEMRLIFLHDQHRLQDLHYRKFYDNAAWAIIEVHGNRAGRLFLLQRDDALHVIDIALMPAFRNAGLGRDLLLAVQDLSRRLGIAKVTLNVEQRNPALRLYERLGFIKTGQNGLYFSLEWLPR